MQPELFLTLISLAVLIISIIFHEVAHGYAANALGDPTAKYEGRLTLNPIPHIDPVGSLLVPGLLVLTGAGMMFGWAKPVPYNPYNLRNQRWGEAIVGSAGVATNIVIALIFALLTRYFLGTGEETLAGFTALVAYINLFLGLFNLIPFPPLDGFTVLRGVLPYNLSVSLRSLEATMGGFVGLVGFLAIFSFVFAAPFAGLVRSIFAFLVG